MSTRILKGAKPANIPIELATKFQTAVNLKAAKALGVDIPPTLLAAAEAADRRHQADLGLAPVLLGDEERLR